jgi:hypothetical protein
VRSIRQLGLRLLKPLRRMRVLVALTVVAAAAMGAYRLNRLSQSYRGKSLVNDVLALRLENRLRTSSQPDRVSQAWCDYYKKCSSVYLVAASRPWASLGPLPDEPPLMPPRQGVVEFCLDGKLESIRLEYVNECIYDGP